MLTSWGEALNTACPLPEYPRPQLRREKWLNLNGVWRYAVTQTTADEIAPQAWTGDIVVPFSPESELSCVKRTLHGGETLWYQRSFALPEGFLPQKGRLLLHFGAVDQEAKVWLNGRAVGAHMGGYNAFTLDVTEALTAEENCLTVGVHDDTDGSWHTRGKQKTRRGGIWYTPQSGIWQTVWLEATPENYIQRLEMIPMIDEGVLRLTVYTVRPEACEAAFGGETFAFPANAPTDLPVRDMRLWSPESPYLYDLTVTCGSDRVESYFGMRKTEIRPDSAGHKRLFLNNQPYFHNGLLDQGYWPDGLYTAPADAAMIYDISTAKDMGYTMLRKHIKVEPMRWYYHCDRLGMLVWQDMPSGGGKYRFSTISFPLITGIHHRDTHYRRFARDSAQGRAEYEHELTEMVTQLFSVPSLVLWVPFNEGWGQFDAARIYQELQSLDPTRPIDHASGWHDQWIGDLKTYHVYFKPYRFKRDRLGRAVALSEFGGYNLPVEGHCWNQADFGYKRLPNGAALWAAYQKLYEEQVLPFIPQGLCAAVYTQLTDVEDELNGVMTYDRRAVKLPVDEVKALNARINQPTEGAVLHE